MAKTRGQSRIELLQGTLDLLILQTLRWGPRHGYGIAQMIRANSSDALQVDTGSLYPALHRLELRGLLRAQWGVSDNNRRAKFYQLTRAGKRALQQETAKWDRLSAAVARVMHTA